jgi:guanyl-specific ribonuclease Sa
MVKNYSQFIVGLLTGFLLGLFISKAYFLKPLPSTLPAGSPVLTEVPAPSPSNQPKPPELKHTSPSDASIPQQVLNVLSFILTHHTPMDGYVGGRVFSNRERILPLRDAQNNPIQYQEWDVHAKIPGQNRDAERIVTGSDGRNWYSNDHYKSFTEIK